MHPAEARGDLWIDVIGAGSETTGWHSGSVVLWCRQTTQPTARAHDGGGGGHHHPSYPALPFAVALAAGEGGCERQRRSLRADPDNQSGSPGDRSARFR
jgi:hypothetical protein